MDDQKQQVAARVKEANNILVTVSANPSVDQLAACIGVTLALNKLGKHATAVFSGQVPSTIEFLQPEKTLEKNTDSLRDFIIALDKSKADKLRYKVEDKVVKIFITPYKTSISDKDLEFSQGDFNVDVVLAIGVHNQADLDQAITAHGRILHDATVVTINTKPGGELGSINWLDPTSSSLSELGVQLVDMVDKSMLDTQISTALLTGIVAETERFSNNKTTPRTMTLSAELMTAGANQQLVATKLEAPAPPPPPVAAPIATSDHHDDAKPITAHEDAVKKDDGTLEIVHDPKAEQAAREAEEAAHAAEAEKEKEAEATKAASEIPAAPVEEPAAPAEPEHKPETESHVPPVTLTAAGPEDDSNKAPQIHIDEHGSLSPLGDNHKALPSISHHDQSIHMVTAPPSLGGPLNAASMPESYDPSIDTLTQETEGSVPKPSEPATDTPPVGLTVTPPVDAGSPAAGDSAFSMPYEALESEPPASAATADAAHDDLLLTPRPDETLAEIEQDVHSSHVTQDQPTATAPLSAEPQLEPDLVLPPSQPDAPITSLPEPTPTPDMSMPAPSIAVPSQPVIPEPVALPPAPQSDMSDFSIPAPAVTSPTVVPVDDSLDTARDAVMDALNASAADGPLPPVASLNAQPVDLDLGHVPPALDVTPPPPPAANDYGMAPMTTVQPTDPAAFAAPQPTVPGWNPNPGVTPDFAQPQAPLGMPADPMMPPTQPADPNAPPPVPPPMMPPTPPYNQPY
jgi:hypothetical protein